MGGPSLASSDGPGLVEFLVDAKSLWRSVGDMYSRLMNGRVDCPRPRLARAHVDCLIRPEEKEAV